MGTSHSIVLRGELYRAIAIGQLTSLVQPRALGILAGDQVVLRDGSPSGVIVGAWLLRRVVWVSPVGVFDGLHDGYAALSLNNGAENDWAKRELEQSLARAKAEGRSDADFWRAESDKQKARRELDRSASYRTDGPPHAWVLD